MTLKTRFTLLVVGAAIIPPIMTILLVMIGFVTASGAENLGQASEINHIMQGIAADEVTVQSLERHLRKDGRALPVYLADAAGRMLVPEQERGSILDLGAAIAESQTDEVRLSSVLAVPDENGGFGTIVLTSPMKPATDRLSTAAVVPPILGVLASAIMSALLVRSLDESLARLQVATRRIADGDLDFALTLDGTDRIASLTRSFDQMRCQLKEQLDRSSRFLMGISHDLKTPLSSISGYVDAIRDGYADTPERLQRYAEILQAKTHLLEARISALIDYAKQETREWKLTLEATPLAAFLHDFAQHAEPDAVAHGHTFISDIAVDEKTLVTMDGDMVFRALENLVDNGFRHSEPGSRVYLASSETAAAISIRIENTGSFIPEEALPRVFDPLYRAQNSRQAKGFGLGLAVVKSVITSHGWSIRAHSERGASTVFEIVIPKSG